MLSAKREVGNHLHAVFFLLTAEQRLRAIRLREQWFILTSLAARGSMVLLECKLHNVPMVKHRAFQ